MSVPDQERNMLYQKSTISTYAINNLWSNPFNDRYSLIKLHRLTNSNGTHNSIVIGGGYRISLPDNTAPYHVFKVGRITPTKLGLNFRDKSWMTYQWENVVEINNTVTSITLLNSFGMILNMRDIYICYDNKETIYISVKANKVKNIDVGNDTILLKTYNYNLNHSSMKVIGYDNGVNANPNEALLFNQNQNDDSITTVNTSVVIDGLCTNFTGDKKLNTKNFKNGLCRVDSLTDFNINKKLTLELNSIKSFFSSKDKVNKYIIHPPKGFLGSDENNWFWHLDDIDIYIKKDNIKLFYYRADESSVRMLTHRDYSLNINHVESLITKLLTLVSGDSPIEIELSFRPPYHSKRVMDKYKIHELYKLNDTLIMNSLEGLSGTIVPWKADTLESSTFMDIFNEHDVSKITADKAIDGFGFNYITKTFYSNLLVNKGSKLLPISFIMDTVPKVNISNGSRDFKVVNAHSLNLHNYRAYDYNLVYTSGIVENGFTALSGTVGLKFNGIYSEHSNLQHRPYLVIFKNDTKSIHKILMEEIDYHVIENTKTNSSNTYSVRITNMEIVEHMNFNTEGEFKITCHTNSINMNTTAKTIEKGFIKNGSVSLDIKFSIRDDLPLTINLSGTVYPYSDSPVNVVEQGYEGSDSNTNGLIYTIEDRSNYREIFNNKDVFAKQREESIEIDKTISNYMSSIYINPKDVNRYSISKKTIIVSGILNNLILALKSNNLFSRNNDEHILDTELCNRILYSNGESREDIILTDFYDMDYIDIYPYYPTIYNASYDDKNRLRMLIELDKAGYDILKTVVNHVKRPIIMNNIITYK